VLSDCGQPLRVFTSTRPVASPLTDGATVQRHLSNADLLRLAPPSENCNCHGWTFLGGHGWLRGGEVERLLPDNGYHLVDQPQPRDLVLYRDAGGQIQHSGQVFGLAEDGQVLVESKWGDRGLYVHLAALPDYGRHEFYRSAREGHRLHGWEQLPRAVNTALAAARP
jgi:hypothetical protein